MAIVKAEQVFTTAAGFSEEEVAKIRAAADGKTVSFGRCKMSDERCEMSGERERMLTEFAKGKTGEEVAKAHGMSRRQVFYALKRERAEGLKGSRVEEWKGRGLSLREIGRLSGKSHEAVRQAAGERSEDGGMRSEEAEREGTQTDTD